MYFGLNAIEFFKKIILSLKKNIHFKELKIYTNLILSFREINQLLTLDIIKHFFMQ